MDAPGGGVRKKIAEQTPKKSANRHPHTLFFPYIAEKFRERETTHHLISSFCIFLAIHDNTHPHFTYLYHSKTLLLRL